VPTESSPTRERPTLETIARSLGVSRATVSNAYNRPDQLSPRLRERIMATAAELGYAGPDPAARRLRQRRAGAVGVLMADRLSYAFSDPAAVLLLDGLAEVLEPESSGLLILPGVAGSGPPPDLVRNAVVDGLVTYCLSDDDPALAAARARQVPLVLVDHGPQPGEIAVLVDDRGGAAAVARHLLDLGHRRIAVVAYELARDRRTGLADAERQAGITFAGTRERLSGYRDELVDAGLDWDTIPVWECAHNGRQPGREAGAALLERRPRPTAIIALSDELAIGVLEAARDAAVEVPRDLSVVGFDDIPAAAHIRPPLTTVRQPLRRKGEQAGRHLLDLRAGRRPRRPRRFPTELIVRASTARPRR
jgi:DNA-binding LacI/PurR family transcriptional regulator